MIKKENSMSMTSPSRRTVLRGLGAAGLALTAAPLAACSGTGSPAPGPIAGPAQVELPAYRRFEGVYPELVGTETGVPDAFLRYPAEPKAAIAEKPAGSPISFMAGLDGGVPAAAGQNRFWSGLNDRLGAELVIQGVPGGEYAAKLSTALAGGALTDVVQLNLAVPRLEELLPRLFVDLSEYLSGDAVHDFPMLANFPNPVWRNVAIAGGLYGVPYPGAFVNSILYVRSDLAAKLGVEIAAGSAEEFTEFATALTNERENRWALGSWPTLRTFVMEMFGAPNEWRIEDDGRFTRQWETEEFRAGVEYLADLRARGLFHPDTFSGASGSGDHFKAGRLLTRHAGVMWWPNFYRDAATIPGFAVQPLLAPKADGSGVANKYLLNGMYTFAAIRKEGATPDRIREILRVQNYLAAPFGTAEHLYRTYGEEGVHFNWKDGEPALNQIALSEVSPLPVRFMSGMPTVIYTAGLPEVSKANFELQNQVIDTSLPLPTMGLLSPAQSSIGTAIDRDLDNVISEVVQGRKTMDDFDRQVKAWRTGGGSKIADEYAAANRQGR